MKKGKRIFSIVLSIALVISTFGCGVVVNANDNEVESISYTKSNDVVLYEYQYGNFFLNDIYDYETEEYYSEQYFNYYYDSFVEGDILTINYSNGTSVDYVLDENLNFISDQGDVLLPWNDVYSYDNQSYEHWDVGDSNYFYICYGDCEVAIPVTIIESPVDHIEYICDDLEYYENTNGDIESVEIYDEENEEYYYEYFYRYNFKFRIGDQLIVYNKDGSVVEYKYTYFEDSGDTYFYSPGYEPLDSYNDINYSIEDQYYDHWYVGNTYYFEIEYFGSISQVPVSIIENPVDHIEYICDEKSVIENTNGYTTESEYYDYEAEEWAYEEFYYYYLSDFVIFGDTLRIFYKDGNVKDFVFDYNDELGECFASADGTVLNLYSDVDIDDNQYSNHWTIGNDNYFTVRYLGVEADVKVAVLESPVDSIEFKGKAREYIEHTNGNYYEREYFDEETGEEYTVELYYYSFEYKSGDSITVHYKDGSVEVFEFDTDNYEFISSLGNIINTFDIDLYSNQDEEWVVGNDYYFTISYLGKYADIPASVIENPLESIEYIPVKDIVLYENASGYINYEDGDGYEEKRFTYYAPSCIVGDTIVLHYKNGKTETYTYDNYEEIYMFTNGTDFLDENLLRIEHYQHDEPWTLGSDNYFYVSYLGIETPVQVTIVESPVERVEYKGLALIAEDNYWYDFYSIFQGCEFEVYFNNGKSKTYFYRGRDLVADDGSIIDWYHLNEFFDDDDDIFEAGDHTIHLSIAGAVCDIQFIVDEGPKHQYVFIGNYYDRYDGYILEYTCADCNDHFACLAEGVFDRWDSEYVNAESQLCEDTQLLDVVHDGIINAKDYAYLLRLNLK